MPFTENFNYLKKQKGLSGYQIAKDLDCSQSSVKNWGDGKIVPRDRARNKIAEYFGITLAELDGDELPVLPPESAKKAPESAKKEPAPLDELLPGYFQLSEENKLKAQEYIALLLNSQHTP